MGPCQIEGCLSTATRTYTGPTTAEEQNGVRNDHGVSFNPIKHIYVCEAHEEEIKKDYPFPAYLQPYTGKEVDHKTWEPKE